MKQGVFENMSVSGVSLPPTVHSGRWCRRALIWRASSGPSTEVSRHWLTRVVCVAISSVGLICCLCCTCDQRVGNEYCRYTPIESVGTLICLNLYFVWGFSFSDLTCLSSVYFLYTSALLYGIKEGDKSAVIWVVMQWWRWWWWYWQIWLSVPFIIEIHCLVVVVV